MRKEWPQCGGRIISSTLMQGDGEWGTSMSEPSRLDKTFSIIMRRMVETGQAPFYTEIATELGVSVEEGRKALHDLFEAGIDGWLFPNTDYIASFAPFSNLPTQYHIAVDGQQKWFGQ